MVIKDLSKLIGKIVIHWDKNRVPRHAKSTVGSPDRLNSDVERQLSLHLAIFFGWLALHALASRKLALNQLFLQVQLGHFPVVHDFTALIGQFQVVTLQANHGCSRWQLRVTALTRQEGLLELAQPRVCHRPLGLRCLGLQKKQIRGNARAAIQTIPNMLCPLKKSVLSRLQVHSSNAELAGFHTLPGRIVFPMRHNNDKLHELAFVVGPLDHSLKAVSGTKHNLRDERRIALVRSVRKLAR
mmetsp:Transcript_21597/g.47480  ORF Transcript_21597/g.47480 Transcript_21597/m.47480 type:complete len:242 (-) Transcript_21597:891-1616(-)